MSEPTIIGRTVLEYLKKYPLHSKKNLSKLLYKEHPFLFDSSEHARRMIRYYTHASGERARIATKNKY